MFEGFSVEDDLFENIEELNHVALDYRQRLALIIADIRNFHGTEKQFEGLMDHMVALEKWMVEVFSVRQFVQKDRLSISEERELGIHFIGKENRTIDDLLALMQKRYDRWLERSLDQERAEVSSENFELVGANMEGVILPPGDVPIFYGFGENTFETSRFDDRLRQLLLFLQNHGIYSDDVIVVRGKVHPGMMRQLSYTIVEIPRIGREVLVCDQVGEATFVVKGILNRSLFATLTKEDLQERYGERVVRVVYRDSEQWEAELARTLFENVVFEEKVNVVDLEKLRQAIFAQVPTPEEWAGMKQKEKAVFKVGGLGLYAIATRFGAGGGPIRNHSVHMELGRKIYGEHEVLRELTNEELLVLIRREVSTPEEWAGMKYKEKLAFKVGGLGLNALSTRFGVEGNPIRNHSVYLELGRKIYGEDLVLREVTNEELLILIRREISTPEEWAGMRAREKGVFKVGGLGLKAVSTRFGVEGSPIHNHSVHLELGRKIYGEHEVLMELTDEEFLVLIRREISTPEEWVEMRAKEKGVFKVGGLGLKAVSTRFGVEGDPCNYHSVHLEFGRKIYGEDLVLREVTNEELLILIRREISTPEEWAGMRAREKGVFKVGGLGLNAVSTQFGVEGNPIANHTVHLELGRKIYGEDLVLREVTNEELLILIRREISTPEEWAGMRAREKGVFKVGGLGLTAVSTRFGVEGSPIHKHSVHLELGQKIYGIHPVFTPDNR